jgi:hypothetical protein
MPAMKPSRSALKPCLGPGESLRGLPAYDDPRPCAGDAYRPAHGWSRKGTCQGCLHSEPNGGKCPGEYAMEFAFDLLRTATS